MKNRVILEKATDDCFEHLGVEVLYSDEESEPKFIKVLKFAFDSEYEFGDGVMVGNTTRFEIRIKDIERPLPNHKICIDEITYQIIGEPTRNLERQTWDVEGLAIS